MLGSNAFVLQKCVVSPRDLLEECVLFVIGLQYAILVRAKLLKLRFEDLVVLGGDGLFVQDEHVGNVIVVGL